MRFEEAFRIKNKYGDTMIFENQEWHVRVVPLLVDDLRKYSADFRERNLTDEDAKQYSSDNEFQAYRFLKRSTDGSFPLVKLN
jgi:ASC-1-like (ASCH) protein